MTAPDAYFEMHRDIIKDDAILHTPNPGRPITLSPDEHHMIVSAMRYAQGRNSYVVRRTTRFVIDHWEDLSDRTRHILTRDAGLLTPDPPEPCIYPDTGEREWHMEDGYVSVEDGIIHVIHDETDDDNEPDALMPDWAELRFSTTTKGRETAYAILAACDLKDTQDEHL